MKASVWLCMRTNNNSSRRIQMSQLGYLSKEDRNRIQVVKESKCLASNSETLLNSKPMVHLKGKASCSQAQYQISSK